jgi:K+-transporting ATPase A subunit
MLLIILFIASIISIKIIDNEKKIIDDLNLRIIEKQIELDKISINNYYLKILIISLFINLLVLFILLVIIFMYFNENKNSGLIIHIIISSILTIISFLTSVIIYKKHKNSINKIEEKLNEIIQL